MARESFRPSPSDRTRLQVVETDDSPVLVDLDGKEAPIIKVVDDRTEEEKTGSTRDPAKWPDAADDDPSDMTERAKKRFNRLKAETETEKRIRLQVERERDEAVGAARRQQEEIADLRRRLDGSNTSLATSMTEERKVRMADAERRLSQAHAEGNSEAIAAATRDMTTAAAEITAIAANTPRPRPENEQRQVQQEQPRQQTQAPQLTPDVIAWVAATPRFNRDVEFTRTAVSIHNLLEAKGIMAGTPSYIKELDKRMKAEYPDHQPYSGSPDDGDDDGRTTAPRRTNAVAPGSRDTRPSGGDQRTVELTATEFAVAKRLGLTTPKQLAMYAAEKQKRDQNGKGAQ
jgi:hypothetical protein